jgi:hypothetical protein
MQQSGAFLTSSESIIFQLIGDSKHEKFRQIAGLIKEHSFEINSCIERPQAPQE